MLDPESLNFIMALVRETHFPHPTAFPPGFFPAFLLRRAQFRQCLLFMGLSSSLPPSSSELPGEKVPLEAPLSPDSSEILFECR